MTNLAQRMQEAADTLEEWSARQGYGHPVDIKWNAKTLRIEAEHLKAELTLTERMARDVYESVAADSSNYDVLQAWFKESYRRQAARLIELGWYKV